MFEQLIAEASSRFNMSAAKVTALVRSLLGMMSNEATGGMEGFVATFRRVGLGDALTSWFGGKEGTALTQPQVESALGAGTLTSLATSTGLTRGVVGSATAYLLPRLTSLVTPSGVLPSNRSLLSQVSTFLDRPATAIPETHVERRGWPRWIPWALAAVIGLVAWMMLRGPAGTLDPELTLSSRDGKVSYSGVVHDEATRASIVSALQSAYGQANVQGTLRVDPRVKQAGWVPRVGDLAAAVNRPGVDFSLKGDAMSIGGWLSATERQTLANTLRRIWGVQSTVGALTDPVADAVRAANEKARAALAAIGAGTTPAALVQAMNMAVINFPTGSAVIPSEGMDVIRPSAEALKHAPAGTKIEIGGHTDTTGDTTANMALSVQRAEAVKQLLVGLGVPAAMLTTKGYGDTRPRAGNETEYGRFQNRRIEYSVLQ